jgi:PIN domain nuclease of toxin-antitoxin system
LKLLLDTHCWLWMGLDPDQLGPKTRALIANLDNEIILSSASAWEIAIKSARGKLQLPLDPAAYVRSRVRTSGTTLLPIALEHALGVVALPDIHRDPFDRLLIAQAQIEGYTIVTRDGEIPKYDILTHDAST